MGCVDIANRSSDEELYTALIHLLYDRPLRRGIELNGIGTSIANALRKILTVGDLVFQCGKHLVPRIKLFLLRWTLEKDHGQKDLNISRFIHELLPLSIEIQSAELYREYLVHFIGKLISARDKAHGDLKKLEECLSTQPDWVSSHIRQQEFHIRFDFQRALMALVKLGDNTVCCSRCPNIPKGSRLGCWNKCQCDCGLYPYFAASYRPSSALFIFDYAKRCSFGFLYPTTELVKKLLRENPSV